MTNEIRTYRALVTFEATGEQSDEIAVAIAEECQYLNVVASTEHLTDGEARTISALLLDRAAWHRERVSPSADAVTRNWRQTEAARLTVLAQKIYDPKDRA